MLKQIATMCEAKAALLKEEIEQYERNPVGVGEHIDYAESIMTKLEEYDKYKSMAERAASITTTPRTITGTISGVEITPFAKTETEISQDYKKGNS